VAAEKDASMKGGEKKIENVRLFLTGGGDLDTAYRQGFQLIGIANHSKQHMKARIADRKEVQEKNGGAGLEPGRRSGKSKVGRKKKKTGNSALCFGKKPGKLPYERLNLKKGGERLFH